MAGVLRKLIGILLILTVIVVALTRYDDRPVEALVPRWAPPPSEFVAFKGQVVHLRDEGPRGDPLPIVLVHGTGSSLHTWEAWVQALKVQRRVITFDLPGFGLTGPFTGDYPAGDYRGDTYGRFVLDLLDHLNVQRVVMGGNSLGGEVAWRTAVLAPDRVAQLILVDASGPEFTPQSVPPGFLLARLPVLNWLSQYLLPRPLVAATLHSVYGNPARVTETQVDRHFDITLREGNRRALVQRLQLLESDLRPELIATLKLPTLVLWGERDRLIPPSTAQVFGRAITGSQVVLLPGVGHMPQEEDPAASLAVARAFLGLR